MWNYIFPKKGSFEFGPLEDHGPVYDNRRIGDVLEDSEETVTAFFNGDGYHQEFTYTKPRSKGEHVIDFAVEQGLTFFLSRLFKWGTRSLASRKLFNDAGGELSLDKKPYKN